MGRYDLTDEEYALIAPELPTNEGKVGRSWGEHRRVINGIFGRLHTGAPWPAIPERHGPWKTRPDRSTWWRRTGTWDRLRKALPIKLDANGLSDWEQWGLDGTLVRVHRSAAGARRDEGGDGADEPLDHALGRSAGGFTTKIHLRSDSTGVPLDAQLTPGQTHESTHVEAVLEQGLLPRGSGRMRTRPRRLAADRADDAKRIRKDLRARGIQPIIPPKRRTGRRKLGRPVTDDRHADRRRSTIAQCAGWLKECRAVATRDEKLALNDRGLVKLACIERYVRLLTRPQLAV